MYLCAIVEKENGALTANVTVIASLTGYVQGWLSTSSRQPNVNTVLAWKGKGTVVVYRHSAYIGDEFWGQIRVKSSFKSLSPEGALLFLHISVSVCRNIMRSEPA